MLGLRDEPKLDFQVSARIKLLSVFEDNRLDETVQLILFLGIIFGFVERANY